MILGAALQALLLLGDSLAAGMRPYLPVDRAVTITGASSNWRWESYADRSSVTVLVIGSNDVPSDAFAERTAALGAALAARSRTMMIVGPPCSTDVALERRLRWIEREQRLALAGSGVKYVTLRDATVDRDGRCRDTGRALDGLHFTVTGYERLANWLRQRLL